MKTSEKRKPRSSKTYNRKLTKIKKWHSRRTKFRESWSEEKLAKAKPLQPLSYYVEQLRKTG